MFIRSLPAARWLATLCLSGAVLCATAASSPDAGQFLAILQKQAASEAYDQFAVTGLYPDEHGRQFAAAILAKLGEQAAYRDDMQAWLAANPAFTQEELVSNWLRRYQQIRQASFEFLDDTDVALLFRLPVMNALYGSSRSACETRSQKDTYALVHRTRQALIDEHKERLAGALAAAYVRELARLKRPVPGDRPVEQVQTVRIMEAFKKLVASLPAADAAIVSNEYAHDKRAPHTPQEECANVWVASHAILDATSGDAGLLRKSVTNASYSTAFSQQALVRAPKHPLPEFTPGKAFVYLPVLLAKRKVSGIVNVKVSVDETGTVSGIATAWHSLAPAYVTSANGETFPSIDVLMPVLEKYYREGQFAPRMVDGKAVPFSFSHEYNWQ